MLPNFPVLRVILTPVTYGCGTMAPRDLWGAQERYVEQAKQALQAAPTQGAGLGGLGGLGLGSARLEDLRGARPHKPVATARSKPQSHLWAVNVV